MNPVLKRYESRLKELKAEEQAIQQEIEKTKELIQEEQLKERQLHAEVILARLEDIKAIAAKSGVHFNGYITGDTDRLDGQFCIQVYLSDSMYRYKICVEKRQEVVLGGKAEAFIDYCTGVNDGVVTNPFKRFANDFSEWLPRWVEEARKGNHE